MFGWMMSSKFSFKYDSRRSGSSTDTMLVEEVMDKKPSVDDQRTEDKLSRANANVSTPSCEVSSGIDNEILPKIICASHIIVAMCMNIQYS